MTSEQQQVKTTPAQPSHRGIVLPRTSNKGGATTTSALPVGAPPLFSVDSTPERHVVRESTSFVRRVNEWIAGESRRDAGLLRTLQMEHSRAGDAAWKAMIESEILAADDDVQVAAAAFRRLDAFEGRRVDCARDDDADAVDEWRRDFDRVMDRAAAGASSEHAKVSEQLAAQAAALREQRAATAAAAAAEAAKSDGEADDIGELTMTSDGDGGDGRRMSLTEPPVVQEEKKEVVVGAQDKNSTHHDDDDDNDNDDTGDDDKDEFFDVDEEIWEKEPSPLRMRR